jgi:hypothetical protein
MTHLEVGGLLTFETDVVIQQVKICDVIVRKTVKIRKQMCNFIFFIMAILYQKWMLSTVNLWK